jgi:hypothetical protein
MKALLAVPTFVAFQNSFLNTRKTEVRVRNTARRLQTPVGALTRRTVLARPQRAGAECVRHCNDHIGWSVMPSGNDGRTIAMP